MPVYVSRVADKHKEITQRATVDPALPTWDELQRSLLAANWDAGLGMQPYARPDGTERAIAFDPSSGKWGLRPAVPEKDRSPLLIQHRRPGGWSYKGDQRRFKMVLRQRREALHVSLKRLGRKGLAKEVLEVLWMLVPRHPRVKTTRSRKGQKKHLDAQRSSTMAQESKVKQDETVTLGARHRKVSRQMSQMKSWRCAFRRQAKVYR